MRSPIVKRSVIIGGHKTSVSLEAPFWEGLRRIAELNEVPVSGMLKQIDAGRDSANLSSAIRVFVLEHYRTLASAPQPGRSGGRVGPTFVDDAPILP